MRKVLSRLSKKRCVICALMAAVVGMSAVTRADEPVKVFRAGAYAADISPTQFPISSNGSMRDRQAVGVHDPLHARCLVLDDGATRIAIVVCDSCMIPRHVFDEAKKRAAAKTGIAVDQMLMSATHTHTGVTVANVFQSKPEKEYIAFLIERIAEGIERANSNREPARVGWGSGHDPSQVFNRRWFMKKGNIGTDPFGGKSDTVRMNPPGGPTQDRPAGPIDPEIGFLSVQSKSGRPIAFLANYSLHYVGAVPGNALSADYFGEFAERISRSLNATKTRPAFVGMMSNGTSGNINNINFTLTVRPSRRPFEQIKLVAASVADATMRGYKKIEHRDWVPLVMQEKEIELGVRRPSEKELSRARKILVAAGEGPLKGLSQIYAGETVALAKYPATVKVKLQAIRIGGLGIVSSPCETFVETGLAIKKNSPLKTTFTIELANGYNGYLPTPEHHGLGGYETWRARSSYLAVDAEPKVRATLLELLNKVSRKKKTGERGQ